MLPVPLARGAAVLAALVFGVACVPELGDPGLPGAEGRSVTTPKTEQPAVSSVLVPDGAASAAAVSAVARRASSPRPVPEVPRDQILRRDIEGGRLLATAPEKVAEVARRTGTSVAETTDLLRDDTVWVARNGQLYVRERPASPARAETGPRETAYDGEPAAAAATSDADGLGAAPALTQRFPESETFRLESRPGARRTIYIDADGAYVGNTQWNDPLPNGTWRGYNESGGAPEALSAAEHAWIQEVWREVAEAYAPFDVNVTTRDLGDDAWQRRSSDDLTWGSRVVITTSATPRDTLCGSCLGLAFLNTFGRVDRYAAAQPAWVFAWEGMSPVLAAQAVSHEVGHNLGLKHDGEGSEPYTFGSIAWGPIMGGATYRATSQWSRGEYGGASNTEDDLDVITRNNLPLRPDDHGDTPSAATALGPGPTYAADGVISTRADLDVFGIDVACSTALDVRATGIGHQTTLDLRLDLLNADGSAVATSAPTAGRFWDQVRQLVMSTGMDGALRSTVAAGRYFVRLDGVGHGNATASDKSGWSDYGSLGNYRLTASTGTCPATPSPSSSPSSSPTSSPTATPSTSPSSSPTPTTPPPSSTPSSTPSGSPTPSATPSRAPARAPGAPVSVRATSGTPGGQVTVGLRWNKPTSDGGSTITGYRVTAYQLGSGASVRRTLRSGSIDARSTSVTLLLPAGRYSFTVTATNAVGSSAASARSAAVTAR